MLSIKTWQAIEQVVEEYIGSVPDDATIKRFSSALAAVCIQFSESPNEVTDAGQHIWRKRLSARNNH